MGFLIGLVSWVERRAGSAKAHASSIYLFVYYLGGSPWGATGGLFYSRFGWTGLVAFVAGLTSAGLLVAWRLYYVVPLSIPQVVPMEPPMP